MEILLPIFVSDSIKVKSICVIMKQVVLNIEENKYRFFMELVKSFDFVQIEEVEGDSKKKIVKNLSQGFKDLKLYKQGKLKTSSAKDFLNEL